MCWLFNNVLCTAPNCSTGFPEVPENTTQFLTNGDAIWTGLQVVIPEMKFTCSGIITAWTGWFTINQNFAIVQSVRMQVGVQPGDVIGFQVLIPTGHVQPATPLISRNSSMTMYYTNFTHQPPSKLSPCDSKVGMLKGIQPQVSPIFGKSMWSKCRTTIFNVAFIHRSVLPCAIPTTTVCRFPMFLKKHTSWHHTDSRKRYTYSIPNSTVRVTSSWSCCRHISCRGGIASCCLGCGYSKHSSVCHKIQAK